MEEVIATCQSSLEMIANFACERAVRTFSAPKSSATCPCVAWPRFCWPASITNRSDRIAPESRKFLAACAS